jgi:peptidoglycan/xylan/chitin deacetylase (PgdA/CDA1 family)
MRCLFPFLFLTLLAFAASAENLPGPPSAQQGLKLIEPRLHVARSGNASRPRVALTFDACMGEADERILSVLVRERIPATIFVTARWIRRNPKAVNIFLQNLDLFELENHGQNHVPAVDVPTSIYGIAAAGSPEAVRQEVAGGAGDVGGGFCPTALVPRLHGEI